MDRDTTGGVRTLLRREESYAVHAIVYVAENPGASNARIAEDLQFPPAFLAKVLRKLVTAGFIRSRLPLAGSRPGKRCRPEIRRNPRWLQPPDRARHHLIWWRNCISMAYRKTTKLEVLF